MSRPLRLALCNELFQRIPFPEACRRIRAIGYQGLEIAPFTLSSDPVTLAPARRSELHSMMASEGLEFAGIHWLLAAPAGLHVTTPDSALRKRSWDYVRDLVDLCADLAGSSPTSAPVMVFGSPNQRSTVEGATRAEAAALFTEGVAQVAVHAEERRVKILVEALPRNQSDVINSLAEAVEIVRQIESPSVQTMFDTHNAADETEEHVSLIRKYRTYIWHVHVNEMDGREPGMGNYDFSPLLGALDEINYRGWVSVEVFDFSRDPDEVARRAREHLEAAHLAAFTEKL